MDFLRLTGGKVLAGKGVYDKEGIIVDILGDKNTLVGRFNLTSFVSQTLSIAPFPLTTVCGPKASVRFLFPLPGMLLHLLCNYCDITAM